MGQKVIDIVIENCTGCHQCEMSCSFYHTGLFARHESKITIWADAEHCLFVPGICMQCTDAPCMEVCPTGALHRVCSTAPVLVDPDRCVGCRICSLACPFGAIHYKSDSGLAFKCDLCDGDPQCVKACFPGALNFVDREEMGSTRRQETAELLSRPILEASGWPKTA
jgi:Fe-S-cluster-containing hydrogenase component 2